MTRIFFITTLLSCLFSTSIFANTNASSQLLHHTPEWVSPHVDSVVHIQTQFVKPHPLTFEKTSDTAKAFVESFFDGDEPSFGTEVEGNTGTGFFIAPGLLATNYHVIEKAERIWITTKDGRREQAILLGSDQRLDLALLKVNILNIPALTWADSETVKAGDVVAAIGNPYNLAWSVNVGRVSGDPRASGQTDLSFIQSDVVINPGNSGGPLLNANGHVIGVNTRILSTSGGFMGIGLAIPSNLASQIIESIRQDHDLNLLKLGASVQTLTPALRQYFEWSDENNGALITQVDEKGLAAHLGLMVQDIIVSVNQKEVENASQLGWILGEVSDESSLEIVIVRKGIKYTKMLASISDWHKTHTASLTTQDETESTPTPKIEADIKKRLNAVKHHPNDPKGIFITHVWHRPYLFDGLHPRDLILEMDQVTFDDPEEFYAALEKKKGQPILLKIQRRTLKPFFITLQP